MKKALVSIILVASLAATPVPMRAAESGTTAAIEHLNQEFASAWNAHDAAKMGSVWAESGDLINPFGQKASGRAAIVKFFDAEQAGVMKGTTYKIESLSVRQIDSRTAIGDWESVITGMKDPGGKPLPPFPHHVSAVYVEKGGHWLMESVRAYGFQTPPAAPMK